MTALRDMAEALVTPGAAVPEGLDGGASRLGVHRNAVACLWITTLSDIFPSVFSALEADKAARLALDFARESPPRSPVLHDYGHTFPEALAKAGIAPWLVDLARLDRAWLSAYHAADASPLAPDALAALPPADLISSRVALHPAATLVRCAWPVTRPAPGTAPTRPAAPQQTVYLVNRPGLDVQITPIGPEDAAFVSALAAGKTIAAAAAGLSDLVGVFRRSVRAGIVVGLSPDAAP